jgi:ATP-dependent Clp protease protease subunit
MRFALPNTRIMIHQPSGAFEGQATDIKIQAQEVLFLKERINEILAQHTGQDVERIAADSDRDRWMKPEEAKEYGLIDDTIQRHETADEIHGLVTPLDSAEPGKAPRP